MGGFSKQMQMWWNALVFFVGLQELGVPLWRSAIVALIVLISTKLVYGTNWLFRAGVVLMFASVAVWLGFLPTPDHWPDLLDRIARPHN